MEHLILIALIVIIFIAESSPSPLRTEEHNEHNPRDVSVTSDTTTKQCSGTVLSYFFFLKTTRSTRILLSDHYITTQLSKILIEIRHDMSKVEMYIYDCVLYHSGWYLSSRGNDDKNCGRKFATPCHTLDTLLHQYYTYLVRKKQSRSGRDPHSCLNLFTDSVLILDEAIQVEHYEIILYGKIPFYLYTYLLR